MANTLQPFKISDDYPFKEDLERQRARMRTTRRSVVVERITMTEDKEYLPMMFVKIFQNKQLLDGLTPSACKIFIHICCKIGYLDESVELHQADVGLSKPTFYKALLELTHLNVIRKVKNKKELYWINLSLVVSGDPHKRLA